MEYKYTPIEGSNDINLSINGGPFLVARFVPQAGRPHVYRVHEEHTNMHGCKFISGSKLGIAPIITAARVSKHFTPKIKELIDASTDTRVVELKKELEILESQKDTIIDHITEIKLKIIELVGTKRNEKPAINKMDAITALKAAGFTLEQIKELYEANNN